MKYQKYPTFIFYTSSLVFFEQFCELNLLYFDYIFFVNYILYMMWETKKKWKTKINFWYIHIGLNTSTGELQLLVCCEKLESLGIAQKRRRRIGMDNGRDRDGLMIMMCANILSGTTDLTEYFQTKMCNKE